MTAAPALTALVGKARRRALWNLVLEQTSTGAAAALAGSFLLLLLGTEILGWYWLPLLFLSGAGIAAWRTMRNLPTPYAVAQSVDQRLDLRDSLSTALHFQQAESRFSPVFLEAQRAEAEVLAAGVAPSLAMPWRVPRQLYIAGAMLLGAATLFVLRYGILGTLDLRQPIVEAVADFFHPANQIQARAKGPNKKEDPLAIPADRADIGKKAETEDAPDDVLNIVDTPDVTVDFETKDAAKAKQSEVKAAGDEAGDDMEAGDEKGDRSGEGKDDKGDGDASKGAGEQGKKDGPQNAKQGDGNEPNSSLMDKMRDAMANLMNKMNIPNQGKQSQQRASNQKGGQKGAGEQQSGGQKGEKGEGQQQGKGSPSDDPDAEAKQGEQQAQSGQGRSNDKTAESGAPTDAKSGMGKQDGSKDLKDAQQIAAMGKLSEIFGKRAQNMTGEVMVEVSNGKNQGLRTQYSQKQAAHKESGGEIHRDEVPLRDQQYVQQYFEQVRKSEKPVDPSLEK